MERESARILNFLESAERSIESPTDGFAELLNVYWLGDSIALTQRTCDGVSFHEWIAGHNKGDAQNDKLKVCLRFVEIVRQAHESGRAHGDLKPGNILVSHDGEVMLVDYLDFSSDLDGERITPHYAPSVGGVKERDVFAVCKIVEEGRENPLVIDFITENLRAPTETLGDIRAQFAAYHDCAEKLGKVLHEEQLDDFEAVVEEIISRSSQSMRKVIAELPDGCYTDSFQVDGFDEPLTIACAVTVDGEKIDINFAGTSGQIKFPINSVMNYTYAYSCFALKCLLDPSAPNNSGSFDSVTVQAPEGSLLNAARPAPVWGRHLSGHYAPPAIFGALSAILPQKVIAESGSPLWNVYLRALTTVPIHPL